MASDQPQLRKLAIVPAYNEQGMVGRVVREISRQASEFDVLVIDYRMREMQIRPRGSHR